MDRIAPLAKILAEANGIDWQKLQGSGAGGQIVEQDILNYLSRVMSGEEDPPSTPVDLPPPDWNGEEVPTADMLGRAGMSADLLRGAGVDTDLTAFVEQTRAAAPATPEPAQASLEDDAMEFELDDEPEEAPAATSGPDLSMPAHEAAPAFGLPAITSAPEVTAETPAPTPEPAAAPAAGWNWGTPAPAAAPEAEAAPAPAASMPQSFGAPAPEPTPVAETPAAPEVAPAAAPAAGGLASGLGSLLSRLYQKPAEPAASAAPVAEVAAPSEPTPEPVAAQPEPEMQPEPEVQAPAAQPEPMPTEESGASDQGESAPVLEDGPVAEPVMPDVQPIAAEMEPAQTESMEPEEAPEAIQPEVEDVAAEPEVEPVQPEVSEPEQPEVSEPVPAPAAAQDEPVAAPMPAPVAAPAGNAVWFGAYLRRDANVAALHDLRGQVTAALSRDLPLALLVARAAARHADSLGLGSVAVHADGGAQAVGSGSLRDALDAGAFTGTPDLLVVDAGSMDLDDLHFPHTTTLSVGRVQDGRAALTLNGDVDAARAAQFLAQVAGTLEQPILLVL